MNTGIRNPGLSRRRFMASLALLALAAGLTGCDEAIAHGKEVHRPAAADFGLGPRPSASMAYKATLLPHEPLRLRQLQSVALLITDGDGHPVEGASISIDGGMPEHGHGLPTQPRVTRSSGSGVYEIDGVRFSMSGWWVLKLVIDSPLGTDRVTFNLDL